MTSTYRGKHQLAFGVNMIRTQQNSFAGYLQNGNFYFSNLIVGDTLAEYMMGILDSSSYGYGQSRGQPTAMRASIPGLYAQDTIRLSQKLTLNLGVRWEPTIFPADYFGRGSTFRLENLISNTVSKKFVNAPAGMLYYGDEGVPEAFTSNRWTNFAPRVGIVWNPRGDGKQTLRAGAAMLYDSAMLYFPQRIMSNPPFVNEIDLAPAQTGPFDNPWRFTLAAVPSRGRLLPRPTPRSRPTRSTRSSAAGF